MRQPPLKKPGPASTDQPLVIDIQEKDGRRVILTKQCWEEHILAEHPDMQGHLKAIESALQHPDCICENRKAAIRRSGWFKGKRVIYYRAKAINLPYARYLKVIVQRGNPDMVISAYPEYKIHEEERVIWSREKKRSR